jgi:hypothetical protein
VETTEYPLRVQLPKGQWASLRDPEDVTERRRRPILDAQDRMQACLVSGDVTEEEIKAAGNGDKDSAISVGMKMLATDFQRYQHEVDRLLLLALLEEWSYGGEINEDTIQDLPGRAYDQLLEVAKPLMRILNPNFEPDADAESPTPPAGASA